MVSDIKVDKELAHNLPPIPNKDAEKPKINQRNLFTVLVNNEDGVLTINASGDLETCPIDQLKDRVKTFLNSNRDDDPTLPELEETEIEGLGKYKVSKGVILLQCDRGTSYKLYFQVQNELTVAITELRNELSMKMFGHPYSSEYKKNSIQKMAIDKAIPLNISETKPQ